MKTFYSASFAVGASAAILARDQCCFQLSATGGVSGTLGQLSDGQNRVGGDNPAGTYCINNGAITDGQGRGCILTPPTTQFQCDMGATPTQGFMVGYNGELEYNGDTTFYACPATNGMYNIYTQPVDNQPKCVKVTLNTGGKCVPQKPMTNTCPAPSTVYQTKTEVQQATPSTVYKTETQIETPAPSTVYKTETEQPSCPAPSTVYKTETEQSSCPAPSTVYKTETQVEQQAPSTVYKTETEQAMTTCPAPSTVYVTKTAQQAPPATTSMQQAPPATASMAPKETNSMPAPPASSACPQDLSGQYQYPHLIVPVNSGMPNKAYGTQYTATINSDTCTIFNFDVPQSYAGNTCSLTFLFPEQSQLQTSSYDFNGKGSLDFYQLSSPANQQTTYANQPSKKELGSISPMPGNSYTISSYDCPAGKTPSIEVCSSGGLDLSYFQDYNPAPIGLYITAC